MDTSSSRTKEGVEDDEDTKRGFETSVEPLLQWTPKNRKRKWWPFLFVSIRTGPTSLRTIDLIFEFTSLTQVFEAVLESSNPPNPRILPILPILESSQSSNPPNPRILPILESSQSSNRRNHRASLLTHTHTHTHVQVNKDSKDYKKMYLFNIQLKKFQNQKLIHSFTESKE